MKIDWWIGKKRFFAFVVGVFLISSGIAFMINAMLGVAPWDVFHIGIEQHISLSLGQIMQIVGFLLIIVSSLLDVKPNLGTILNMFLIGFFFDLIILAGFTYAPDGLALRVLFFCIGIFLYGIGTGMYISADWGPGPRDSLMVALNRKLGLRIGYVRGGIEVSVLGLGFFLGGPVGIGTVVFSLSIGFIVELGLYTMKRFFGLSVPLKRRKQERIDTNANTGNWAS